MKEINQDEYLLQYLTCLSADPPSFCLAGGVNTTGLGSDLCVTWFLHHNVQVWLPVRFFFGECASSLFLCALCCFLPLCFVGFCLRTFSRSSIIFSWWRLSYSARVNAPHRRGVPGAMACEVAGGPYEVGSDCERGWVWDRRRSSMEDFWLLRK